MSMTNDSNRHTDEREEQVTEPDTDGYVKPELTKHEDWDVATGNSTPSRPFPRFP